MNTKVRDLFRIETKDIVSFTNFNQIYYVFEQMVLYDIDVPEIEGLSERVPYALNKIATEKLDRNDIITFFPIIWGKFEPYVRKLLYIINPSKYRKVRNNKNSSVVNVLAELGIKVFVQEKDRTKETEAIYTTYNLRNTEAHVCETWSICKCYDKLAKTLAALLIVTNKVLPDIQIAMKGVPKEKQIRVPLMENVTSIKVDIFDARFHRYFFYNLNDYYSKYQRIDCWEYNRNGWLVSEHHNHGGDESLTTYEYEYKGELVVRCNVIKKEPHTKSEDNLKEKKTGYYTYSYNDQNQIIMVQQYDTPIGYDDSFYLCFIIEIEYLTDGGLCIKHKRMRDKRLQNRSYLMRKENEEDTVVSTEIRYYSPDGRLIKRCKGQNIANYFYSDSGMLSKIEYTGNLFDEVKYIGDNMIIIRKERDDEIGFIWQKRLFKNGKLRKIQYYSNTDRNRKRLESPILANEIFIEYFDEK